MHHREYHAGSGEVKCGSAYVGGNSNNDAKVGTFYSNLNNLTSNTNWNIGANIFKRLISLRYFFLSKVTLSPDLLVKIGNKVPIA